MNNFFTNIRHIFGNMFRKEDNEPWLSYYSKEDRTIQFTRKNIYEYLEDSVKKSDMDYIALNYFGTKINYDDFIFKIKAFQISFSKIFFSKGLYTFAKERNSFLHIFSLYRYF